MITRWPLLISVAFSLSAWVAWAGEKAAPANDLPDDFFWKIIGGICVVVMAVVSYQTRQRDTLLDKVAGIIYGTPESSGLMTRVSLVEDRVNRCDSCSGEQGQHHRCGEAVSHQHRRAGE